MTSRNPQSGDYIAANADTLAYKAGDKFGEIETVDGDVYLIRMEPSRKVVPFRRDQFTLKARPLRKTYSPKHPYVIVRDDSDDDDGIIGYEIWDERPETYHRLCTVYEDPGEDRGEAKRDAELIVRALNPLNGVTS